MTNKQETEAGEYRILYSGLIRLHILHHASLEPIFGLDMIEELMRHGYRIGPGTLYPILHEMEARGWLRSDQKLVSGRFRRVYRATASGKRALVAAKVKVRELFGELFETERSIRGTMHRRVTKRRRRTSEEVS